MQYLREPWHWQLEILLGYHSVSEHPFKAKVETAALKT